MSFKFTKHGLAIFKDKPMRLLAPSGYYFSDGIICLHEIVVDSRHKDPDEHNHILADLMAEFEKQHQNNAITSATAERVRPLDCLNFNRKGKLDPSLSAIGLSITLDDKTEYRMVSASLWEQLGGFKLTYNFQNSHDKTILLFQRGTLCGMFPPLQIKEDGVRIDKAYQDLQNGVTR
jgi:hypothetical protein